MNIVYREKALSRHTYSKSKDGFREAYSGLNAWKNRKEGV
jgi:hypothetical protein